MELRDLAAFREVARHASFSQAAARLGFVQSTISAQIQSLERDIGTRLFDRLGRSVALTDAGRALLPYAERILEDASSAEAEVAGTLARDGELVGTVRVSAPESLLTYRLPALLSRFRKVAPKVIIELKPTTIGRFRGDTRRGVATGLVDVAFVLDTLLSIPGFRAVQLVREDISVVAAPGHRLAGRRHASPIDLDGDALLLPEAPDSGCVYRDQFERHLAERHVTPGSKLEFAGIETVKQCVVAGMGVSALLSVAVDADIEAGRLVRLPWREPFEVYTQVVWSDHRYASPALTALIDMACGTFSVAGTGPEASLPKAVRSAVTRRS